MGKYWLGIVFSLAIAGVFVHFEFYAAALVAVPLFAWYLSRILVHGGFDLWRYARHGVKQEWNGKYYEFAGSRLRAEETDDELVFIEKDVLAVIEQPKSRTLELFGPRERIFLSGVKEMALTQAGCERLLSKCPHRDAKKLMLYLQREAFFPYLNRHPGRRP